jgi:hypothetical protein
MSLLLISQDGNWTYIFLTVMEFEKEPVKALPAACPKCDTMLGNANYHQPRGLDSQDMTVIICQCGYFGRHANTNVCK